MTNDEIAGYKSCGKHGAGEFGTYRIDVNCAECIRTPKAITDAEAVQQMRAALGLEPRPAQVTEGEQLRWEEEDARQATMGSRRSTGTARRSEGQEQEAPEEPRRAPSKEEG